jgi:quercetin dioxygenase-like cupin family protein
MSIVARAEPEPMVGDPDDHRPGSSWALRVDPGDQHGRVETIAIIEERIGVGDAIPLHAHDVDEAITVLGGVAETRLGTVRRRVAPGTVIFIPAGTPHGTANVGPDPLDIQAVFPATTIEIAMLERNPAPGTEGDAPRRTRYDLRTGAFVTLDEADGARRD